MKKTLITISALLLASLSFADAIQCKVISVHDGNTITCITDEHTAQSKQLEVKLWGISAPESGQTNNQKAKQALSDMALGRYITVIVENSDRTNDSVTGTIFKWYSDLSGHMVAAGNCLHSHYVSEEEINRKNNTCGPWPMVIVNINHEMIKQGMAWYVPHIQANPEYEEAQEKAQQEKLGLWSQPNPTPPWKWGKQKETN